MPLRLLAFAMLLPTLLPLAVVAVAYENVSARHPFTSVVQLTPTGTGASSLVGLTRSTPATVTFSHESVVV